MKNSPARIRAESLKDFRVVPKQVHARNKFESKKPKNSPARIRTEVNWPRTNYTWPLYYRAILYYNKNKKNNIFKAYFFQIIFHLILSGHVKSSIPYDFGGRIT